MEINFGIYKDVSNAFDVLFAKCQDIKVSSKEFEILRNSLVARTSGLMRRLIRHASNTHCLFEILADNNKYCNWMDVRILMVIAISCGNSQLQSLIEKYTEVIYSKPLFEVWNCVPHYSTVKDAYYRKLKAICGDKDPDNITVEELIKSQPQLAKEIALLTAVIQWDGLLFTWYIPYDKVHQPHLSLLIVPQQIRKDRSIQYAPWMPHHMLQKDRKDINCGE